MTCCVQRRAEYLKMELDKNLIMHVLRVLGPVDGPSGCIICNLPLFTAGSYLLVSFVILILENENCNGLYCDWRIGWLVSQPC